MADTSFAHYKILALLGRGGMGEVHRALDTKLGREVALKLLPEDFARDPERLARFRREAKLLASLQHPNIAGIFGIEEANNRVFLAMELAEGSDLSVRITEGPIPEDEALQIARQLAAGLEEAHEKGVVHRDLKPANIKLSEDGKVKILDFGLARAFAGETAGEENLENSPTITAAMSRSGMILGTAAYMSPEQARGKTVDRRADIWAFGVVLFEMLSGKRMFEGETVSDTLAAVLRAEIAWDQLPENTSHGMRLLLERCLERDPMRRLRDIGEARIFLDNGAQDSSLLALPSGVSDSGISDVGAGRGRGVPVWAAAALALVVAAAGVVAGWKVLGRQEPSRLLNLSLPTPANGVFHLLSARPGPVSISPDGTMVVYSVRDEAGKVMLHLRRLDSPDATVLSGTDGAAYPFWSPDSHYIGFASGDGKLKKVAVSGGPPVTLCAASNMKGGTWNEDGVILFAPSHDTPIHRVSASGGESVAITELKIEERENSHRHPRFLPGGKEFLFLARTDAGSRSDGHRIYIASLDGGAPRLVTHSQTQAEYSRGNILSVREGILLASPFDPGTGTLGDGVPLVEDILQIEGAAVAVYTSTPDGMLTYQVSTGSTERALEWAGAAGPQLGRIGTPDELFRPRVSPDGKQAVVEILDPDADTNDLWLVDLESGLRTRFTFDPGDEKSAQWSHDMQYIFYTATVDTLERVMMQPVEGTGGATILHEDFRDIVVDDVSGDDKALMLSVRNQDTDWDVYSMSVDTGELTLVVGTDAVDYSGVISPDGRWLAYGTDGGGWEVYVRPMSGGQRRWQVSRGGGLYPFWSPDGNTLYYIEGSGQIQAVPVDGSGATFRAGAPKPLVRVAGPDSGGNHVSIHPDGERILHVAGEIFKDETGYLRLVTDWQRGLAN